jgi:hypothetical protein
MVRISRRRTVEIDDKKGHIQAIVVQQNAILAFQSKLNAS